jgi:hypothetical protein
MLEEFHSYLQDNSLSNEKQNNLRQNSNHSQTRRIVQELIIHFQNNQASHFTRKSSFFVLDFIQANYELIILNVEKGDWFEEKMKLMSSSIQLHEELQRIDWHVKNQRQLQKDAYRLNFDSSKINDIGEELLMIYNFFHLLLSNNQHLFSNLEMKDYCQIELLNFSKKHTEMDITNSMHSNIYYLQKKS